MTKRLKKPIKRVLLRDDDYGNLPPKTNLEASRGRTVRKRLPDPYTTDAENDVPRKRQRIRKRLKDTPAVTRDASPIIRKRLSEPTLSVTRQTDARSKKPAPKSLTEERVGPGNPPKHTRFKKGVSGNAKGRPKGSKNIATLLMEAANGNVVATLDGKQRKISKIQATTLQLATKAAGGDPKSITQLIDWVDEVERRAAASRPAPFPFSADDKLVIDELYNRMIKTNPSDEE